MTCQIISSNPEYRHISWLKDGLSLRPEEMWGAQEKLKLTLSTVTKEMSGKYQCEALNDIGSGKSEEVDLQVLCEPPGRQGGGRQRVRGMERKPLRGKQHASACSSRCSGTFQGSDPPLTS